jgi:probable HAF family extracellular repeat protein
MATAISAKGQVLGGADGHTFLYSDGKMTDLGATFGTVNAINDNGQMAGCFSPTGQMTPVHAFFYDGKKRWDLGTGDLLSFANAINASGQVVGSTRIAGAPTEQRSFLYRDGKMVDLGVLGRRQGVAYGINASGQVVGSWLDDPTRANPPGRAFLYSHGKTTSLNDLIAPGSGWILIEARAINDKGQIAGWGNNPKGRGGAFLLTPIR